MTNCTPLTLDAFARTSLIDPCSFMGLEGYAGCEAFSCSKRNSYVAAANHALSMIDTQLRRIGGAVCDRNKEISVAHPFFSVPPDYLIETRRTRRVSAMVSASLPCDSMAFVNVNDFDLEAGETIVSATVEFPPCACQRLGVQWCGEFQMDGMSLSVPARAYNFLDLDSHTYPINPDDATFLPSVYLNVVTTKPANARVHWINADANDCDDLQSIAEVCVDQIGQYSLVAVDWECTRPITDVCGVMAGTYPIRFTLDGVQPGLWRESWNRAMVALMNNLLPVSECGCSEMSRLLYNTDVAVSDRVYPGVYRNGFGILTPGGYLAWMIVTAGISESTVLTI